MARNTTGYRFFADSDLCMLDTLHPRSNIYGCDILKLTIIFFILILVATIFVMFTKIFRKRVWVFYPGFSLSKQTKLITKRCVLYPRACKGHSHCWLATCWVCLSTMLGYVVKWMIIRLCSKFSFNRDHIKLTFSADL